MSQENGYKWQSPPVIGGLFCAQLGLVLDREKADHPDQSPTPLKPGDG